MAKDYAVGVLFVHGMGEQEQGDSVTQMGDELTEWLRQWISAAPNSDFKIREARLRTEGQVLGGSPDHPIGGQAHVSVTITDESGETPTVQEWLLAESWWAKAFRQATFIELVAWAFSAGPWLIASQRAGLENRFREAAAKGSTGPIASLGRTLVTILLMVLAAVLASIITPVFLALLVLSLVPIPGVTGLVRALVNNLSGSFGDLLVLVRSPVRFAAMAEQVRSDIDDIYKRCDQVIVLAHSQGSAVSWHAIRRTAERPEKDRSHVALFLSFGQAFRKLKSLYLLHRSSGTEQGVFLALATLSTLLLVGAAYQGAGVVAEIIATQFDLGAVFERIGSNVAWFGVAVAVVLALQEVLVRMTRATDRLVDAEICEEIDDVRAALPGFRWLDLWASADPAPNGPLLARPPAGVESYKIRNLASTILDHAIYWSNRTVFVSAVAFAAASFAPPSPMGTHDLIPDPLRAEAPIRGRRVTMLLAGRVLFLAALTTSLWGVRRRLPDWGAATLDWVNSLPLPDWFGDWPPVVNGFVAAALVALIGLVGWWVMSKAWDIVIGVDESAFFARKAGTKWGAPAAAWLVAAVLLPTAVMVALASYLNNWGILLAYLVISGVAVPLAVVSLSAGGTTLDQAPEPAEQTAREDAADDS
jgi:hypothetical protein